MFFPLFFFLLFCPYKAEGASDPAKRALLQRIEILKQDILNLTNLVTNMQFRGEICSPSYAAINLSDGSVLLEKNFSEPRPIASITKLMTAVIALENIENNRRITLTGEMLRPYGYSPALYLGLSVSAEDLLRATLIQSTNDAAESLSYFIGRDVFVSLMNKKAKELEMNNTFFYDAHGLSALNQSTPEDLSKLLFYIYENHPEILEISKDNNFWLPDKSGQLLKFRNLNAFYPLPWFLGGKTGYIPQARQTLAGIFDVNKDPVAIVVLYSTNRQADTFSILRKIRSL